jgi:hypothetical protein
MTAFFLSPFAIPICAIVGVFAWLCISAITGSVQHIVQHRNEIQLKQLLAERCMSAEEIERVVMARGHEPDDEMEQSPNGSRMVG